MTAIFADASRHSGNKWKSIDWTLSRAAVKKLQCGMRRRLERKDGTGARSGKSIIDEDARQN